MAPAETNVSPNTSTSILSKLATDSAHRTFSSARPPISCSTNTMGLNDRVVLYQLTNVWVSDSSLYCKGRLLYPLHHLRRFCYTQAGRPQTMVSSRKLPMGLIPWYVHPKACALLSFASWNVRLDSIGYRLIVKYQEYVVIQKYVMYYVTLRQTEYALHSLSHNITQVTITTFSALASLAAQRSHFSFSSSFLATVSSYLACRLAILSSTSCSRALASFRIPRVSSRDALASARAAYMYVHGSDRYVKRTRSGYMYLSTVGPFYISSV